MSKRNDAYKLLADYKLSREELERAKARVRAAKQHIIRKYGLDPSKAEAEAVKTEVERLGRSTTSSEHPLPPPESGLSIRGSRHPKEGQNPLHWSFTIYDISVAGDGGRGKKRRVKFEEIPSSITAMFPKGVQETLNLKRRMENEQSGMMQRIEEQEKWIENNKQHSTLKRDFIEARNRERSESDRKTKKGSEATALRVIFDFFLSQHEGTNYFLPDIRKWHLYYSEFVIFLRNRPPTRRSAKGEKLSKNTQKNYINVLNRYVDFVWKRGKFPGVAPKCENYKRESCERRDVSSIILADEKAAFVKHFNEEGLSQVAAFMKVGNHIAARPAELLGISIFDVVPGALPDEQPSPTLIAMKSALEGIANDNGLVVFGYVVIRGQIDEFSRQSNGSIKYYPSKTAKTTDAKFHRYCPIVDKEVWDVLCDMVNAQEDLYKARRYGDEIERYLIFDKLTLKAIQQHFRDFRSGPGIKWREKGHTPHCCRHTGCTFWVTLAKGNLNAAQAILGHASPNETKHYSHLATMYAEEMKKLQAKQDGESFFDRFKSYPSTK